MIYQQSVFEPWPIESESVQAVICSPPYYALRKYAIPDIIIGGDKDCKHEFYEEQFKTKNQINFSNSGLKNDGRKEISRISTNEKSKFNHQENVYHAGFCIHCNAWKGQYGLEPTPQMYVEHTRLWAKEAWRVLRNDGVFFLNIADSYSGSGGPGSQFDNKYKKYVYDFDKYKNPNRDVVNYPKKCQLLIPERISIMLVEMGWIRRNFIVWYKPNAMPESATDRFSKKWEPIFMFTKQEKYYFDLDAVREKCPPLNRWGGNKLIAKGKSEWDKGTGTSFYRDRDMQPNDGMKNPGDVWVIPTSPSSEKHFAMWPERLVERMVRCSTKAGDTVLDCFAGSATTLKVAEQLHRSFLQCFSDKLSNILESQSKILE